METHQKIESVLSASKANVLQANHFKNKTPVFKLISNTNHHSYNKARQLIRFALSCLRR